MEFVKELPKSGEKDAILVIVKKFTKYRHLFVVTYPFTTQDIA